MPPPYNCMYLVPEDLYTRILYHLGERDKRVVHTSTFTNSTKMTSTRVGK
jgi:hypothetical protein